MRSDLLSLRPLHITDPLSIIKKFKLRYKELKYRHQIVEALYNKLDIDADKSKYAYDLALSLTELNQKTGITKNVLEKQLAYLESQEVVIYYGPNPNNKGQTEERWFLSKYEKYLSSEYLEERKVKMFESYKRMFAYIGIPLGLILSGLSISNKLQTNNNTQRIDKLETNTQINETDQRLTKIIFYRLDSLEFDEILQSDESEGIYEVDSDYGFNINKVIESFKGSSTEIEITNNKTINELFQNKNIEHPYGFVLYRTDGKFQLNQGIYTDSEIQEIISDFINKKDE
jgi:hypothetical protein